MAAGLIHATLSFTPARAEPATLARHSLTGLRRHEFPQPLRVACEFVAGGVAARAMPKRSRVRSNGSTPSSARLPPFLLCPYTYRANRESPEPNCAPAQVPPSSTAWRLSAAAVRVRDHRYCADSPLQIECPTVDLSTGCLRAVQVNGIGFGRMSRFRSRPTAERRAQAGSAPVPGTKLGPMLLHTCDLFLTDVGVGL